MASNEKNGAVRARFRAYALSFAGAALIGAIGLGLVHQHNLHHELAKRAGRLDQEIRVLADRIQQQLKIEAALRSPSVLEARIRELNLGLEPIRSEQRIFLRRTARLLPPVRLQGIVASNIPPSFGATSALPATLFRGDPGSLPSFNPMTPPSGVPGAVNPALVAGRGPLPAVPAALRREPTPGRVTSKVNLATTR
ncbi:MAG: hypothetical protein EXS36_07455 [Pedosphaera sp.]|nr:hypothetical protein [Pedosphaera sp.]